MSKEQTPMSYFWMIAIAALLVGGIAGMTMFSSEKVVEVPKEVIVEKIVETIVEMPGEIQYVEVPAPSIDEEVSVVESSEKWVDLALEQIFEELDNDEDFLSCDGHEFDDDELSLDLDEASVSWNEDGDYVVEVSYQFDWEDNSDERDCKVDHTFVVSWDEDDVRDSDWNEGEVEMLA